MYQISNHSSSSVLGSAKINFERIRKHLTKSKTTKDFKTKTSSLSSRFNTMKFLSFIFASAILYRADAVMSDDEDFTSSSSLTMNLRHSQDNRELKTIRLNPVLSACSNDGTFKPEPDKYYNIFSSDGRVWTHVNHERRTDDSVPTREIIELKPAKDFASQDAAMWRFDRTSSGSFNIINRSTGISERARTLQCTNGNTEVNFGQSPFRDVIVGRTRKESGCKKNNRSCGEIFGGGFEFISKRKSNCFSGRRFKCERLDKNSNIVNWQVKEVENFQRLAGPDLESPVVSVIEDPVISTASELIATLGTDFAGFVGGTVCPFCGGVFSAIAGLGFESPDAIPLDDKLNTLAAEILQAVDLMIGNFAAQDSQRQLINGIEDRRQIIYEDYLSDKHRAFEEKDADKLEDAKLLLKSQVNEYAVEISQVFGNDPSDIFFDRPNVVRGFLGFDVLTYAMMEILAARQELYILEALLDPERSCEDHADDEKLGREANKYEALLEAIQGVMIDQRLENDCCSASAERFVVKTNPTIANAFNVLSIKDRGELIYRSKESGDEKTEVINSIKKERKFDIENFSYPIASFVEYFKGYKAFSIEMCKAVRTNPVVRARFETDDVSAEPVQITALKGESITPGTALPSTVAASTVQAAPITTVSSLPTTTTTEAPKKKKKNDKGKRRNLR